MPEYLDLPPYTADELSELQGDITYAVDGAWETNKLTDPNHLHSVLWSKMQTRDVYDGDDGLITYYRFPDGTIIKDGGAWSQATEAAACSLGYKDCYNKSGFREFAYEQVPIDRVDELLSLAAEEARKGVYYIWYPPESDPFVADFLEEL